MHTATHCLSYRCLNVKFIVLQWAPEKVEDLVRQRQLGYCAEGTLQAGVFEAIHCAHVHTAVLQYWQLTIILRSTPFTHQTNLDKFFLLCSPSYPQRAQPVTRWCGKRSLNRFVSIVFYCKVGLFSPNSLKIKPDFICNFTLILILF